MTLFRDLLVEGRHNRNALFCFRVVASLAMFSLMLRLDSAITDMGKLSPRRSSQKNGTSTTRRDDDDWSSLRIAIYLTTHLSNQHIFALQHCWPAMVNHSRMLQHSDIFLFTAEEPKPSLVNVAFNQTRGVVRTELYENPGYHNGAILPVEEAIRNARDWFEDYDWIIRENPDVLIVNDAPFYPFMVDPDIDAVLVNCHDEKDVKFHTDFFAVRPQALPPKVVEGCDKCDSRAERHFTGQLSHLLESGRFAWLPGVGPIRPNECRAFGETIVHRHSWLHNCTNLFV